MDHGSEAARPTVVKSSYLGMVDAGEAHMTTRTFRGHLGAAAGRRAGIDGLQPSAVAYHNSTVLTRQVRSVPAAVFNREHGPDMAYVDIGVFWDQQSLVGVVLVGLQLPGGVVPVHDNYYSYSALQHRLATGRCVVVADLLRGGAGAVYSGDYVLQPRPGGARHGDVFVGLLAARPSAGRGDVFIGPLPDGVGMVFDGLGNLAQQTLQGTGRADGVLRDANLGAEHDGSGSLADDPGAAYNDPGMASEHLHRLLAFVGIGACSVAVNGLAVGQGSPAAAFHLFMLLLGGLFVVILHVLRV